MTEEERFREWLRSLDTQPAEVGGDDRWNHAVVVNTWEHVTEENVDGV